MQNSAADEPPSDPIYLQEILFAEHRRSILIMFQAIDTGGKDGSIKNLCRGFNPAGVRIASFKTPTHVELDHDFLWRVHKATPGERHDRNLEPLPLRRRPHRAGPSVGKEEGLEGPLRADQ